MEDDLLKQREIKVLELLKNKDYKPLKFKELAFLMQVSNDNRDSFKNILDNLVKEGRIELTQKGKYKIPDTNIFKGTFESTQKGFGFVTIEEMKEDIFISALNTNGALSKDIVLVKILDEKTGKRKEGEVISIVERGIKQIVGTFEKNTSFGFVIPDNPKYGKDIFIPKQFTKGAVTGHKVVVEITFFGEKGRKPEGKIVEIIGHINDPGVDIMSIVKAYELPIDFKEDVMKQLDSIPDEVDPKDIEGRLDIRNWQMVTIDGEDAKDLDDAISIKKEKDRFILGVHIADVTNYVKEGSPLDKEALKRGTSVYLVDRVIPMLPHKLSNGICSLNAGVDRLALSCIMEINFSGKVIAHRIAETVLNIDRRMSYTSVKKILEDNDEKEIEEYKELVPMFNCMKELADILREQRRKRGSIDFDFPESKIILDKNGKPLEIKPYERNTATKIIEDFMLIANETIAEDYYWQELPFVYRTHESPDAEKIERLMVFINNFGYHLKNVGREDIHPKEIQKLLFKIEGTKEEPLISRLTLRSMKQAKYTVTNTGHFGLSTKYYCHFTSPIRRYPDLQIHRIIKENLKSGLSKKRIKHYETILPDVADKTSKCERRADEAEREVDKLKKVQYMSDHIGEIFEGVISGITSWGMYVELPNTVEGMVHINTMLDDYYYYDEESYSMIGRETNKQYKLGEKVIIKVKATDKVLRTIDFVLFQEQEDENKGSEN